jgi:DNA-binding CsgD family transcriptional regulator
MAEKRANSGLSALSKREAETLQWVAKGKTNSEIALLLGITEKTVEKHLERVYRKLGVENRTMAAALFFNNRDASHGGAEAQKGKL